MGVKQCVYRVEHFTKLDHKLGRQERSTAGHATGVTDDSHTATKLLIWCTWNKHERVKRNIVLSIFNIHNRQKLSKLTWLAFFKTLDSIATLVLCQQRLTVIVVSLSRQNSSQLQRSFSRDNRDELWHVFNITLANPCVCPKHSLKTCMEINWTNNCPSKHYNQCPLGLYWIYFFPIRLELDFGGFVMTNPAGAGFSNWLAY